MSSLLPNLEDEDEADIVEEDKIRDEYEFGFKFEIGIGIGRLNLPELFTAGVDSGNTFLSPSVVVRLTKRFFLSWEGRVVQFESDSESEFGAKTVYPPRLRLRFEFMFGVGYIRGLAVGFVRSPEPEDVREKGELVVLENEFFFGSELRVVVS